VAVFDQIEMTKSVFLLQTLLCKQFAMPFHGCEVKEYNLFIGTFTSSTVEQESDDGHKNSTG